MLPEEWISKMNKEKKNLSIKEKAIMDMLASVCARDEEARKSGRDSFKRPL